MGVKKGIVQLLLTAVAVIGICLALSPQPAFAYSDAQTGLQYDLLGDAATIFGFTPRGGFDGHLVIPATLGGKSVAYIDSGAFEGCDSLKVVEIPEGVITVASGSFVSCANLTTVIVPKYAKIGSNAFVSNNRNLTVYFHGDEFSEMGSSYHSFVKAGLISCAVYELSVSRVCGFVSSPEFGGHLFIPSSIYGKNITRIYLLGDYGQWSKPDFLEKVTLPDTIELIDDYTFKNCLNLRQVNIPGKNGLKSIREGAFAGCTNLEAVIIIPASVTEIGQNAFPELPNGIRVFENSYAHTYALENNIKVSVLSNSSVSSASFEKDIPPETQQDLTAAITWEYASEIRDIRKSGVSIGNVWSVFQNTLTINKEYLNKQLSGQLALEAVFDCGMPATILIDITSGAQHAAINPDNVEFSKDSPADVNIQVTLNDATALNSIEIDGAAIGAEYYSMAGSTLTIKKEYLAAKPLGKYEAQLWFDKGDYQVLSIDIVGHEYALSNGEATITAFRTPWGFDGKLNVPSILGGFKVIAIGDEAYWKNTALQSVVVPDGITSIGQSAFEECTGIQSVSLPESINTFHDRVFYGCSGLKSINLPDGITYIGRYAFSDCGMESITIPRGLTRIQERTFAHCKSLTNHLVIPDNITSIGQYAFGGCTGLENVTVSGSVKHIEFAAFGGCINAHISLLEGVERLEDLAFNNCMSVIVPKSVTYIGSGIGGYVKCWNGDALWGTSAYVEWGCPLLATPLGNEEPFHPIGLGVYSGCSCSADTVTQVIMGRKTVGTTSSVRSEESSRARVVMPSFYYTVPIRRVFGVAGWQFRGMKKLESVSIPKQCVLIGGGAFAHCPDLYEVIIPEENYLQAIYPEVFEGSTKIKSLTIPASVMCIDRDAFNGLADLTLTVFENSYAHDYALKNNIKVLLLPNSSVGPACFDKDILPADQQDLSMGITWNRAAEIWDVKKDGVSIGDAWQVSGDNLTISKNYLYRQPTGELVLTVDFDKGMPYTLTIDLQSTANSAVVNPGSIYFDQNVPQDVSLAVTWNDAKAITDVQLGQTSIGSDNYTVAGNTLTIKADYMKTLSLGTHEFNVVFDKGDLATLPVYIWGIHYTVTDGKATITGFTPSLAFDGNLVIPSVIGGFNVTGIGNQAFSRKNIQSVTIPDTVTSIGYEAFRGCRNLAHVDLPNNHTSIGSRAFCGCTGLQSIEIPDGIISLGDDVPDEGQAFCGSGLESITIPGSVKTIPWGTFSSCHKLKEVIILKGVETIGCKAFANCESLTDITIPDSVTSLVSPHSQNPRYEESAFYACTGLKSITIPGSIQVIPDCTFIECSALESVTFLEGVATVGNGVFYDCKSLKSVTFPSSITSLGNQYYPGCDTITFYGYRGTCVEEYCKTYFMYTGFGALDAAITPAEADFDKNIAKISDIAVTIDWGGTSQVTDVKAGNSSIGQGNFSIKENSLIIKKEYLASQPEGKLELSIEFDKGSPAVLTITIADTSPPVNPGDKVITAIEAIPDINVLYGTSKDGIGLPVQVKATLDNGTNGTIDAGIAWDNGTPEYNGNIAGEYAFLGALTGLPEDVVDPGWAVNAKVIVGANPDAFVPVTGITGVPTTATAGVNLTLSGTVAPTDATNQTIVWSIQDAGTTGATISENTLSTTTAGTVSVRATITNGLTASTDYTQDFNITVTTATPPPEPTVTSVTVEPADVSVQKGNTQTFSATVNGTNNPAQTVTWSVGGNTSGNTVINVSGLLTVAADETAVTLTITATSTVDGSKSGTATVTVTTPPVVNASVSPDTGSFDKKTANQTDVQTTVTWGDATGITDVKATGTSIGAGNYSVSGNTLTIKKEYLAAQATGKLVLTVEFDKGNTAKLTISISDTISTEKTLVEITSPGAIIGVVNGTAKTTESLGLPTKVTLVISEGKVQADVTWDVDACSYDSAVTTEQTFTVSGNVTLPTGIGNPNNVPLIISVSVIANAATSTDKTLVEITSPGAIIGVVNGTAKTTESLGLPTKVTLVTDEGKVQADVTWNVETCSYDPAITTEQTFTVGGIVTLPTRVVNPNNVPLTTSVSVTVAAEDECFIATAAFGSKFSWPVEMLRHFRDQYLLSNAAGTAFVKFYYQNSPPIATVISNNPTLKTMVRVLLAPLVASVFLLYHPAILLLVMILAIVLITLRFRHRRYLLG